MLFFQFFNSPVTLKNLKKFAPQENVEMTPLHGTHFNSCSCDICSKLIKWFLLVNEIIFSMFLFLINIINNKCMQFSQFCHKIFVFIEKQCNNFFLNLLRDVLWIYKKMVSSAAYTKIVSQNLLLSKYKRFLETNHMIGLQKLIF